MTLAALSLVPVVAFQKRAPIGAKWPAKDRAAFEKRLCALGTNITELSDIRETCGLPRLSETAPEVRRYAPHILLGERGKAALKAVRAARESLTEGLKTTERIDVTEARSLLTLQRPPSQLRLGELRALYAQAQICRIHRESAPAAVPAPIDESDPFVRISDE